MVVEANRRGDRSIQTAARNNELAAAGWFRHNMHGIAGRSLDAVCVQGEVCEGERAGGTGTDLRVFEDLVFFRPLLKEDFVLAVPRPGQERLHQVLVVLERPLCHKKWRVSKLSREFLFNTC